MSSKFDFGEYLEYKIVMIVEYSLTLDTFINLESGDQLQA